MTQPDTDSFITRWQGSGGAERANYGLFLAELCDVLGVHRPHAASGSQGEYRFERGVVKISFSGYERVKNCI